LHSTRVWQFTNIFTYIAAHRESKYDSSRLFFFGCPLLAHERSPENDEYNSSYITWTSRTAFALGRFTIKKINKSIKQNIFNINKHKINRINSFSNMSCLSSRQNITWSIDQFVNIKCEQNLSTQNIFYEIFILLLCNLSSMA